MQFFDSYETQNEIEIVKIAKYCKIAKVWSHVVLLVTMSMLWIKHACLFPKVYWNLSRQKIYASEVLYNWAEKCENARLKLLKLWVAK